MKRQDCPAAARSGLIVEDGVIEILKWAALLLMAVDHLNKFVFNERLPAVFEVARLSMPLFGFVLAYNLARPGAWEAGAFKRVMFRLAIFGAAAQPAFIVLVGWWPTNILTMLLLSVAVLSLWKQGSVKLRGTAIALFIIAGAAVEFWWWGVGATLAAYWFCRRPSVGRFLLWTASLVSLWIVNRNLWAALVPALVVGASYIRTAPLMRRRHFLFYGFYPTHLCVLWWLARLA